MRGGSDGGGGNPTNVWLNNVCVVAGLKLCTFILLNIHMVAVSCIKEGKALVNMQI